MARYSVGFQSKTMTAVADTTNMTDNGYATFLQGGNATMMLKVNEIYLGGESASSNPTTMVFGRDSTVAATAISGNFNAVLDAVATAPGTVAVYGSTMLEETAWLRERSDLPIIADEAVKTAADIPKLATAYDGINIKLMKAGGVLEALRMIQMAKALNLKIMLGCMIESSVAISAAAHWHLMLIGQIWMVIY